MKSKILKILPFLLIFHPRGIFGKFGPYIALMLFVVAIPFLLSSEAREKLTQAIGPVLQSPDTSVSQNQQNTPPSGQQPQGQTQLQNFDPTRLTGAWAITQTDVDRATWSWSKAKSNSADIWNSQLPQNDVYSSYYCGCTITRNSGTGGDVDLNSCGYQDRGNLSRARRLEWEHIMPASYFGQGRQCWTQGAPQCVKNGEAFSGRSCCEIADPLYQMMSNDPVNLVPSVGEVNADRSNYPFTILGNRGQSYGQCTMRVDTDLDMVEPPLSRRGDIARVYAYMSRAYGITLPKDMADLYTQWMLEDPVSQEEININRAIQASGHRANPYVLGQ